MDGEITMDTLESLSYDIKNLMPVVDEKGDFFDFALKTGHSMITDYSRINREILVKENVISLGKRKEKIEVDSISELKKIAKNCVVRIFEANRVLQKRMSELYFYVPEAIGDDLEYTLSYPRKYDSAGNPVSESKAFYDAYIKEFEEIVPILAHQVMFDILFDKYRSESPKLTLSQYCLGYINFDWDGSVYEAIRKTMKAEGEDIDIELYSRCYKAVYSKLAKLRSSKETEAMADKLDESSQHCHQAEKGDPLIYFALLETELLKKKDAAYNAIIEGIKKQTKIMESAKLLEDARKQGVNPEVFNKYIRTLNMRGKDTEKKPKYVWDYLYFNSSPNLITSKQYNRNFKRDSNTSYSIFIDNFKKYDTFVKTLLAVSSDTDHDFFKKTMDYYHMEIYKRLDCICKMAKSAVDAGELDTVKSKIILRRFHPAVFFPSIESGGENLCYGEKVKYYRPMLFAEKLWQEVDSSSKEIDGITQIHYCIRAKAYELFSYSYKFSSNNYGDIREFIEQYYNVCSYFNSNKVWSYEEHKKEKKLVNNILFLNDLLFGKRM